MQVLRTTIVFPMDGDEVILGMKRRGFGEGWWNGFGGKLDDGESFLASAVRETREEAGIIISNLRLVARLLFYFEEELRVASQVFVADFTGIPHETEEMRTPGRFQKDQLPFDAMWPADQVWVPQALAAEAVEQPLALSIYFDENKRYHGRMLPADPTLVEQYLPLDN